MCAKNRISAVGVVKEKVKAVGQQTGVTNFCMQSLVCILLRKIR
jgi:hypothetical protein